MRQIKISILAVILFSCFGESENFRGPIVYGTYEEIGDANGILIVNQNYIDYRNNAWYTTEFDLTSDSLKFNFSREVENLPGDYVTWWFDLRLYEELGKLEGNNYKTVNLDPDFREERGTITFIKIK